MDEAAVRRRILNCTRCPLHRVASRPVPFSGPSGASVAVLGEAPGEREDRAGKPFVGPSGQLLRQYLTRVGFNVEEVAFLNSVCCYPAGTPKPEEVAACRGNLVAQLTLIRPRWVLVAGAIALQALGRHDRITQVHGVSWDRLLVGGGRRTYFPVRHPSAVLRNRTLTAGWRQDLENFKELTEHG